MSDNTPFLRPGFSQDNRLYSDLAWLWPIISPPEDYVGEAQEFSRAIHKHTQIPVRTLLNLGCGGGHIDHYLQNEFQITGVDLSPRMLDLAHRLNSQVDYLPGDMRSLRLGRTFDAVMIADSIDYMLNEDDLLAAFTTAFVHLNPGGVFCTYAEETQEHFEQNGTYVSAHRQGDLEVALVENYFDPVLEDTTYESTFVYLLRQAGKQRIEIDHHILGVFPLETWERLLRQVGFEVQQHYFAEGDAPFFVGLKPGMSFPAQKS